MRLLVNGQLQLMREVHEAELAGEGLFAGMRAADMTVMGSVRSEGFTTELALRKQQQHLTNMCAGFHERAFGEHFNTTCTENEKKNTSLTCVQCRFS